MVLQLSQAKDKDTLLQFNPEIEQPFLVATSAVLPLLSKADAASSTIVSHLISLDVAIEFAKDHGENQVSEDPSLAKTSRVRLVINDVEAERVLTFKTSRNSECPYMREELNIPLQRGEFQSLIKKGERGRLVEERFPLAGTLDLGSKSTPVSAEIDILLGAGRKIDIESILRRKSVTLPPFVCVDVEVPTPEHRMALLNGDHSFEFLKDPAFAVPIPIGDADTKALRKLREILSHRRLAREGLSRKDLALIHRVLGLEPPKEEGKKRFPWIHKGAPSLVWSSSS